MTYIVVTDKLIENLDNLDIDELNSSNSLNPDVVINEEISALWPNFPKEKYDTDFVRIKKNDLRIKEEYKKIGKLEKKKAQ